MASRYATACVLVLSVTIGLGCSETETPSSSLDGVEVQPTPLIDVLKVTHPELHDDIQVHGTTPDDTVMLFLVSQGGTYVFRRGAGQAPEAVHHARIIAPSSITHITYQDRTFMLWSGDELQLTLAGYP